MSDAPLLLSVAFGLVISRSITVPDNSTMKDGFAPVFEAPTTNATTSTTNDTATDEQPGRESGIPTNITVGIVAAVVGVSVGLLGALGTYLWRRRNSRNGTLKLSPNVEEGGATPFQSASSPNGEFVPSFLHHQTKVRPQSLGFLHSGGPRVASLSSTGVPERNNGRVAQQIGTTRALHRHTQGRIDNTSLFLAYCHHCTTTSVQIGL